MTAKESVYYVLVDYVTNYIYAEKLRNDVAVISDCCEARNRIDLHQSYLLWKATEDLIKGIITIDGYLKFTRSKVFNIK